ncbi:MAG: DUF4081 domain-containing protein [Archangium sp.]|nr:DUF4081 domain-containing protein [Archangium sp.]
MAVIELLGPSHVEALKTLLAKDPVHNLYLLGLVDEFGVVCGPDRAPFAFHGRFVDGDLTAAVFVGGEGGLVIPSAGPSSAIGEIAAKLSASVALKASLGEKALVDVLVQQLGATVKFSKTQQLFAVSPDDLGPLTNPLLRLATEADVEQLVPLAAGCVQETLSRNALAEDPEGFPARVRQRVKTKRTYVLEEKGRLLFKLDIGTRSSFGAEIEGLYTVPDERHKGHASLCLGQISRFLLSSLPRLTLRVDESNSSLAGIARKVGYHARRLQRLVYV